MQVYGNRTEKTFHLACWQRYRSWHRAGNLVTGQLWCRVGNLYQRAVQSQERLGELGKELRDEAAADADSFFAELFGPDAFEAYTYRRKNGHMENGQESVRDAFRA